MDAIDSGNGQPHAGPPLSIGAVAGGPGTDPGWKSAVMGLMQRVVALRGGLESPLAVNVVFHLPGNNLTPEFEGLRTGLFNRRELMVQIAIPAEPSNSPEDDVRELLWDAILLAEKFAIAEAVITDELAVLNMDLVDRGP